MPRLHVDAVGRPGALIELPLLAAAVHDPAVFVAIELEHPQRIAGPPVVPVAVEDDGRVVGDPVGLAELLEACPVDVVPPHLVLEVDLPVDLDGPGHVPLGVERPILVRFDDPHVRIVGMLGHPLGGHQDIGIRVASHGFGFSSPLVGAAASDRDRRGNRSGWGSHRPSAPRHRDQRRARGGGSMPLSGTVHGLGSGWYHVRSFLPAAWPRSHPSAQKTSRWAPPSSIRSPT